MRSLPSPAATTVTGRVTDMCARPLAGALVRVHGGPGAGVVAEGWTKGDGMFVLSSPDLAPHAHVTVEAAGMEHVAGIWLGPGRPLVVRLREAVAFRLRVRDQGGNAVSGAEVGLFQIALASCRTRTGDDGIADLGMVPIGSHRLMVFHPEHQTLVRVISLLDDTMLEVQLVAPAERALRISLVGASAAGLRKARCSIEFGTKDGLPLGFPWLAQEWRCFDRDGTWTLQGLPFDLACRVRVDLPGMALTPSTYSLAAHLDAGPLELSVTARRRRVRTVRGQVLGDGGVGLAGATLHVHGALGDPPMVVTGEQGRFAVPTRLVDGELLRLWLAPAPRRIDSPASLHYRKRRSRHVHVVQMPFAGELVLPTAPSRMLRGRFVRPDGSGLASAEVLLYGAFDPTALAEGEPSARTVTGTAGSFSFPEHELSDGPMVVVARCPGWQGCSRSVELGAAESVPDLVVVAAPDSVLVPEELVGRAAVHGLVLDADGNPVAGAAVVGRRDVPLAEPAARLCHEVAWTMRDGAFALRDLEPGTWFVGVLDLDGGLRWRSEPLAIDAGEVCRATCVVPERS